MKEIFGYVLLCCIIFIVLPFTSILFFFVSPVISVLNFFFPLSKPKKISEEIISNIEKLRWEQKVYIYFSNQTPATLKILKRHNLNPFYIFLFSILLTPTFVSRNIPDGIIGALAPGSIDDASEFEHEFTRKYFCFFLALSSLCICLFFYFLTQND